jgi:excisionase family DNA binding protein
MSYTLAAAAAATGLSKSTILKAIEDGKIAGTRDERGEWHVEPAELHLAYPPAAARTEVGAVTAPHAGPDDIEALGAQIEALLRRAGVRLRQQLDDSRRGHESGRNPAHAARLQLADQPEEG